MRFACNQRMAPRGELLWMLFVMPNSLRSGDGFDCVVGRYLRTDNAGGTEFSVFGWPGVFAGSRRLLGMMKKSAGLPDEMILLKIRVQ